MERDFLGGIGKETGPFARAASSRDEAFAGGSAMQWPFASKISHSQSSPTLFKMARGDEPKEITFDQLPSSGARSINQRPSLLLHPQKSFGIHNQHSVHNYQPQSTNCFGFSTHYSMPPPASSPFFKLHASPNHPNVAVKEVIGMNDPPPRDVPEITRKTAQLTIFYDGTVNVFDNVPLNKAEEIMFSASKASSKIANVTHRILDSPTMFPAKVAYSDGSNLKQPPRSGLSSPISVASLSSSNTDSSSTQNEAPSALPAASVMAREVPQARKASLVRFLEKRKERVANAVPYAKQPMDNK